MHRNGIATLFPADSKEDLFKRYPNLRFEEVRVFDLKEGQILKKPVFDSKGTLLINEGIKISESVRGSLIRRSLLSVYLMRSDEDTGRASAEKCLEQI